MAIKRYVSSAWQDIEDLKRYQNSAFESCESAKKYQDSAWQEIWKKSKYDAAVNMTGSDEPTMSVTGENGVRIEDGHVWIKLAWSAGSDAGRSFHILGDFKKGETHVVKFDCIFGDSSPNTVSPQLSWTPYAANGTADTVYSRSVQLSDYVGDFSLNIKPTTYDCVGVQFGLRYGDPVGGKVSVKYRIYVDDVEVTYL